MSEIIIGTEFNDPDMQAIRDQVSGKNDGIPFLLLPVKIETRFMKANRPVRDVDPFPDVLEGLFEVEDRMHFDPAVLPVHEVLGKIRKFPIQLDDINKKLEGVRRLSGQDNENLKARFAQIEKSYKDLSRSLSKVKLDDAERVRELRLLKTTIESKIHQTGVNINQLKIKDDPLSDSAAFLETLRSISESFNKIGKEKLSVSDRKEKKLIFSFVDDQLSIIDRTLRVARRDIRINMVPTQAQIAKIAELGKGITPLITNATRNIEKIKSDYKKVEYKQKLSQLTKQITALYHGINTRVTPKGAMRRELETIDARSLAWQINLIRFKLKRLNQHAFKTYDEVQNTWDSLNKKLDALRTDAYKVIEGDEEEIKAVRRAWDDADAELEKFHNRVRSFKGVEKQKPKLSKTIVDINDLYRKDLSGLKSGSKNYFSPLSIDRKDRLRKESKESIVFATRSITTDELWVRFYPDDIAIHSHEEALTLEEVEAGKAYWQEIWAASDDYESKLAAWRAISTAHGSQRAAWIVKAMTPETVVAAPVREKLRQFSKELVQVNENLEKIVQMLSRGGSANDLMIQIGQAYPTLILVEEGMRKVKAAQVNLLLKTQRRLIKVKSQVGLVVKNVRSLSDVERSGMAREVDVVAQFALALTRIEKLFQEIPRVTSRELIKEHGQNVFPEVQTKDGSWTLAPHSNVMPDRFVVVTVREGVYKHLVAGKPLPPDKLIVGLDPDSFDSDTFQYDADGNLIVDEKIKWLTDFNEAVNKGMALTITLDEEDVEKGFDRVFVLGIKDTTPSEGTNLLEKLIDNHHYIPEGASFLPVATPTNNTESGESGYRTFEEDAGLSFAIERNDEEPVTPPSDPTFLTDAQRLANGLGINFDVLNNLDYHDRTEVSDAILMNKALFHGTIGNYMEDGLDTLFTLDNVKHTKAFFTQFVTARGFLPSIRVGTQPYGVLATSAFSKFNVTADDTFIPALNKEDFENPAAIQDELQTRYDIRLKQLLNELDNWWTGIRNEKVLYAGNTNPDDPQAHFMEMLGLQANSAEHFYRYGLNIASRLSLNEAGDFSINFDSNDPWSPAKVAEAFRSTIFSGYYFKSDHFSDEHVEFTNIIDYLNSKNSRISEQFTKARVFATRHLKEQSQVLGDIVDNRELSDVVVAASNPNTGTAEEMESARAELQYFIDWLVDSNPWDVHAENKFSEVVEGVLTTGMPSKSLLFLLLRHSMLTAYMDTILKILEFEGLTDQETRKKMGQPGYFYSRYAGSFNFVTKWTYLFSKINRLDNVLGFDMNPANPFFNYMNSLSSTSNGYLNRYVSPAQPFVFNNYVNHSLHQGFVNELTATRDTIRKLKDIPTLRLKQLLTEHIDLCTYRLDAWRLGMVNKRLMSQRTAAQSGIYLGAYGWVEDLRKGGERTPAENIPEGLRKNGDDPVYTDEDGLGFIHTPSLNHAITAAILRAGFHANEDTAEVSNQMAVNLSSARVRMALNLLNGIRNGQDAAAILGYQFERGLHERYLHIPLELDEYIYDFREEFPLTVPVDDSVTLGEAVLTSVVNGMELLETAQELVELEGGPPNLGDSLYQSLKAYETAWWAHVGNANISSASAAKRDAMLKEIDRMADAFDAFGDLCVSESVYQVAKGNHIRASAIMDKLAKGDVPNDIQIADTPRTGVVVTHKIGMFFKTIRGIDHVLTETGPNSAPLTGSALDTAVTAAGASVPAWNSSFGPRALAEPTLNKWAGEMIGNPSKIKCQVAYTVGEINDTMTVTLADLEIQPLDVVHLFGTGPLEGGAELNARIARKVKSTILVPADFEGTADDALINIKYTLRDPGWADDDYSFYEKAGYIQSLRSLMTNSATLAADSLLIPGEEEVEANVVRSQDIDEYQIRITNLQARLTMLQNDWTAFFTNEVSFEDAAEHTFTDVQIDAMRSLLVQSSVFGISGTIPDQMFTYGNAVGLTLIGASDGASKAIAARLSQSATDIETAKDATKLNDVRINAAQEASKKLLGKAFVMLPHFTLRNGTDIVAQLTLASNKGLLRAATPRVMEEWSQGVGRVRERMSGLDMLQMWAENFNLSLPGKKPIQFPFALDTNGVSLDHWLGIAFPGGYQPTEDKLSLVLMNAAEISSAPTTPKAALLIDEWVEIIPNMNETTGIAFNYDQPDAKAPNTLLLAVTPKVTGHWQWDDLVYTLNDTFEMAKNRAVEPEHLEDTVFGQILPAIMTEIVPPQLLPEGSDDSGDAQDNPLGLQVVTDFGTVNDTYEPETEE